MMFSLELPTPLEFPAFPFNPPYEIQVELMRHLYASIEQKKVTIVESPTGTGKTLSLLCASLTWLQDEKNRARKGKLSQAVAEDGIDVPEAKDWVIEQTRERARRELEADEREYEERLAKARKREAIMKHKANARVVKKQRREPEPVVDDDFVDDDKFLPDDDSEGHGEGEDMNISPALRVLMAKVDGPRPSIRKNGFIDGDTDPVCTKIYYASRTHSQLAQVLPELRRLKLQLRVQSHHLDSASTLKKRPADIMEEEEEENVGEACSRTVSLGSRKQLCINDELRAKSKDLDEGCRELLGETGDKRCQYLPPIGEETRMLDLRDQILDTPKDIEDLATAGRLAQTCPYFGSRRAIAQAELITLPYNLLLQKTAREALGIDLQDQIVIVDEAHNLIPTLLSLSTNRLPYTTLATSFQQVCMYVSKFRTRLGASNMLHLKRLVVFLDALKKYVLEWKDLRLSPGAAKDAAAKTEVMTVSGLMDKLGRKATSLNLLEIEAYLRRSKIARKIAGYSDKEETKNSDKKPSKKGAIPPLHAVEAFMLALTSASEDGRVTFSLVGQTEVELKYQLLNPSPHFQEVVDVARSVILAGGTMSPISDVINQLFSRVSPDRLSSFSCGHIIPASNLQALVVSRGPGGKQLEYKAGKQGDLAVIADLGQILLNFTNIVPAGLVVFFPSYNFLYTAKEAWRKSGMLGKFGNKKKIFFEPEESTDVEKVLHEYASAVQSPTTTGDSKQRGALLFAVIGAKLSEGLNFADDLARAVVIIGLPFANLGSPELQERMKYVKRLEEKLGATVKKEQGQKDAAAELYENMCMNAVNQSIGRAIRHRGDWAALILLDRRYASSSIRNKLPKWINSSTTVTEGFGQAVKALGTFYRNKRT